MKTPEDIARDVLIKRAHGVYGDWETDYGPLIAAAIQAERDAARAPMTTEPLADFWITGPPVGRHLEVVWFSGHPSIGHSTKSEHYLRRIRSKVRHDWGDKAPLTGIVFVLLEAAVPMAASWSGKKKREMNGTLCDGTPDVDNICKLALDGIVGTKNDRIVLLDDKQVPQCFLERRWSSREECGLRIRVYPAGSLRLVAV